MNLKILKGSIVTLKIVLLISLVIVAIFKKDLGINEQIEELRLYSDFQFGVDLLISLTILYMVMLFIPFVPASELGISMMVIFGHEGIAYVYVASLTCMILGYLLGRRVKREQRRSLRESPLFNLLFYPKSYEVFDRLSFARRIPAFLQVSAFLNFPGNIVLGGGGGISFMYGFLGRTQVLDFILGVVIGLAPVPLLLYFSGK